MGVIPGGKPVLWRTVDFAAGCIIALGFLSILRAPAPRFPAQTSLAPPAPADGRTTWDPPAVDWRTASPSDIDFKTSSFKCTDADDTFQTCIFENLVLFRGDLWFIVDSSSDVDAVKLPSPLIFEVGNSPSNDLSLPTMVTVKTAAQAREIVSRAAANSDVVRLAFFDNAILQRTRTFNNWFWALNGAGNAYHRLCKYLKLCSAAEVASAALLQPVIESSRPGLADVGFLGLPDFHSRAAKDLLACFGPLFWVNHPSGREMAGRPQDQVVLLRRTLVGVGDDVVQPKAALDADSNVRFSQASTDMALRRVRFLRQCAGLPADPPPLSRPSVLLVNRPYADGRTILGLDDVADRLRRELPQDVPVRTFLPRGHAGIADQANAFSSATVVVAPHGAATANFNFLPHDAVALGVFALPGRWGHDAAVAAALPAPPYNVTVRKVDCRKTTEARTNAAAALPEFQALDPAEQAELLLHQGAMNKKAAARVKELLGMSLLDWMDFRSYAPDPAELTAAVLDAVAEWESKREARAGGGAGAAKSPASGSELKLKLARRALRLI